MGSWYASEHLVIGGRQVPGEGAPLPVENPATEEVFTTAPTVSAAQVETAIASARRSFDTGVWASQSRSARLATLASMAQWLADHRDTLVETAVREVGAVRSLARLAQVDMAIDQARQLPELFATLPEWEHNEMPVDALVTSKDVLLSIRSYEPVGVVAAISPYNFPLQTNVWKVFSALATGCSVILRPSPLTPLTALAMGEAGLAAGLPDGVLNIVVEEGTAAATQLTSDPRVDCVSFTGSTSVGRQIAAQAAPTVKKMVLELGGKSVQLYLPDGLDKLGTGALTVFASHSGQACTAQTRVLVPHDSLDAALDTITSVLPFLPVGDPDDEKTMIGPVISAAQRERIEDLIAAGVKAGGDVVTGGKRPLGLQRGYYLEPTVLRIADNANPVAQQEVFGPVLTVQGYRDIDDAVAIANDSDYGLGGGVYTADLPAGLGVARRIRSGTVQVNRSAASAYTPTGGVKQSGVGRERGVAGLREYQDIKHLVVGP
ncbi:aldehyde dehydrogenase family protein [Candidatus Mycobacterium wuenschmannii]|uniref:aldehyde dehydrogenase (NAD(+)) n=1 Tax=Candidatus Mycobacterium wuenschmannii TaxID=3027808 RepID=A0ABY8VZ66_9MYCO|nr:aldehyde dehydrogenase family protein [Candidatus Mycobacterium wuenschmannii]WIM88079.1 aldehyde dehydrogenase family protein [Candidatus Mycobacterium wuenschmannii]